MKKTITYLIAIVTVVGLMTGAARGQTYCSAGANYSADSEIDYVGLVGNTDSISNNTAGVCAQYTNFTNLTPADLSPGGTYDVEVIAGTCGGNYTKGVIVYVDWNKDYDWDDAGEMVGYTTSSSSTVTYTIPMTVPYNSAIGTTRMRVIVVESSSMSTILPCASYSYGETEDYNITVFPNTDIDAGVSAVVVPGAIEDEGASVAPQVVLGNFGFSNLTAATVMYSLNGGTTVSYSWTGNLATAEYDTVTLTNFTVPPGYNDFCAWSVVTGDTIPMDDSTCTSFYGLPLWDAGVTAILTPSVWGPSLTENDVVTPEVTVENFGVNTITSMDIVYAINGGTPTSFAWTGTLAPNATENVVLPTFIVPGGYDTLCIYTVLPLDGDATNDQTCYDFWADPQFDFMAYEFLSPNSYCSMGMEDVTVSFINLGDTVTTFDLAYNFNGGTAVVETINDTVFPGDTITHTFSTQVDMSTTLYDILFSFSAWSVVAGDPVYTNDTIYDDVVAMHIPENAVVQGDTVVYGQSASLIAFSIDTVNWYGIDTVGAPILATGNIFNTPVLLDTTTYWAQAATGALEQGNLTTSWADNNGSTGNMFDVTAINELTIDSFEINGSTSSVMEVWYRPGSCFGFNTSNVGWTLAGSYTVNAQGNGNPTSLPVGGITIPAGETYGICVTYVSGSIRYITGTGTNEYYANADMEFQAQYGGSYFNYTNYPRVFSGNIYYTAGVAGCASSLIPVTAIVTDIPTQDAGVVGLIAPVDGIELSTTETVTVEVYNYGLEAISNVPVSFSVNGTLVATETILDTIQPYDTLAYTFTATADLSAIQVHDIEACTSHPSDIYSFNDCMTFQVECLPLQFCESYSTSTSSTKITNVTFNTLNNTTAPAQGTDNYGDFTGMPSIPLTPGMTYTASVTSDFPPGSTYNGNAWVEIYIDWNHDGIFDETTDELAFSLPTTCSNTVTGTITVPYSASIGTQTMRVVLEYTSTAAGVLPCGSYYSGETEDYLVEVMPIIPQDGGVVAFVTPGPIEVENMAIPVEVAVQNFGSDTLTAFDIAVEFNGGTAVLTPWVGSIAPGDVENIVVNQIVPVGAVNTICAYTVITGDTNPGNDETCFQFGTSPQYDAYISELVSPENPGCGLGFENIVVRIKNLGDTINGNMLANIVIDGTTTISDVVTSTILPGDSIDFTFGTPFDFTVVGQSQMFEYVANVNLLGDPNQSNDTIIGSIESMLIPDPPTVFDATVPYGSSATLACSSYVSTYWYEVPTGGNFISADTFAVTPLLYDTLTYYVESSGGALGDFQIGTGTSISGTTGYPNPYQTYYWGNREQLLIRAEELTTLGIGAGPIMSIAFNTITVAPMNLTNLEIKLGHTGLNELTGWATTPLQSVYQDPSYVNVAGWNTHSFSAPFMWDGMSNIIIETCFNNSGWQSGSQIEYTTTTYNSCVVYRADNSTVCTSSSTSYINGDRPNMIINAMGPGCPSARVPVTAYPTGIPMFDAGVTEILEPAVYGIDMTASEDVTVTIHNWGQSTIANFPVSYQIDTLPVVTEYVPVMMQSGDVVNYTFTAGVDLSAYGTYNLCAWTGVAGDGWSANDTTCMMIENDSLHYCDSYATGTYGEDIVNVEIGGWSNSSVSALGGYQNFYGITPATLTMNNTYPISITTDFAPGSSYSYTCFVEVYIDLNRDNTFTEPDELVYGALTSSQNTVNGTIFIPNGSFIGEVGMRVVVEGVSVGSQVEPCGTYYHGETEDYMVELGPQIPYDAGVVSIVQPFNNAMENYPSPVEVHVQNFGSEILTAMDILYTVDGGTPVVYNWTGSLAPGSIDNYFLPTLTIPGGFYDLCAYTQVAGDVNTFNDQTCVNLYGIPQFEAAMLEVTAPEGGCDLSFEDVTVVVYNIADTVPVGNMSVSYSANGATPVTEVINDSIFPGDTIVYTFAQQLDMTVTVDTDFEIFAWVDLVGDPNQPDDTANVDVISYLTPADPTPQNVTVWSGNSASLTVTPVDTNLNYFWYDTIGGTMLVNDPVFNTPVLFDTTTYVVQASSATFGDIQLGSASNLITGTSNNPIGQLYTSNASQFIIRADELIAMGFSGGQINSLALDIVDPTTATSAGYNLEGFNIKMGMTADMSVAASWYTGLTTVYDVPNGPTALGWNVMEFTSPFNWDGVSNVIVEFCFSNYFGTSSWNSNGDLNGTNVGFDCGHGVYTDGSFSCGTTPTTTIYTTQTRPDMMLNVMIPGCSANYVEVTANVEYAPYDAAVWAVTEPTTGAYMSLVDVTAHLYNNGLNPISNFPISYTWNGMLQATETFTGTIQPGVDTFFTFTQQLNIDTLWGQHTVCVYTSLTNDGYTLNDESCRTFTNMDGDGIECFSAFQYGWVNDPPVMGEVDTAYTDEWWMVEAPGSVNNAYFSLCGSSFDTKMEIFNDCNSYYIYQNDDNYTACGSGGNSQVDVAFLSAGTYYVRVFGYNTETGTYILDIGGDMPCISVDGMVTNVSCNAQADGAIDLTTTNVLGTTPFSYNWGPNLPQVEDLYNLAAGVYTVTVSDAANCQDSATFEITEPAAIDIALVGTDVTVLGGQDGAVDITVTGGNAPYTYAWSNGLTTEDLTGVYAGYYSVTVYDDNACTAEAAIMIHSPLPIPLPNLPTTVTHTIDIPANAIVTLDGNAIAYGSLLVVYYDSLGTYVPGGYTYWTGMNTTLVAYGDDGVNPGFAAGEYFMWKVYDAATMDYYSGSATYNTMYPDLDQFSANGSSAIWELEFLSIYTQVVQFPQGWSIFSTFIDPMAPNIADLLASIVGDVIIVKSGTGLVYWPQYWLNNINNIVIGQGYQIKTAAATSADFVGYPVEPQLTPLDLPHGWSILGYLRMTPMDIASIFSNQGFINPPFTTVGVLEIAKDDEGAIYWPLYNLNAIGDMEPGEGYQIKLNAPNGPGTTVQFTYPANSAPSTQSSKTEALKLVKYENKVNTGNNMTIGIPAGAWNVKPEMGDEVAVFNAQDKLVGAAVYQGGHTAITVWGDDDITEEIDGAEANTALTLRYFNAATSMEQVIDVQKWEIGNEMYVSNAISVVGKLAIVEESNYALFQNMPNPFNNITEIRFSLPEDANVNISVYNALGEIVEVIVARSFETGNHAVQFDANELPAGNYFYKMTANDFVATKSMNIVK